MQVLSPHFPTKIIIYKSCRIQWEVTWFACFLRNLCPKPSNSMIILTWMTALATWKRLGEKVLINGLVQAPYLGDSLPIAFDAFELYCVIYLVSFACIMHSCCVNVYAFIYLHLLWPFFWKALQNISDHDITSQFLRKGACFCKGACF